MSSLPPGAVPVPNIPLGVPLVQQRVWSEHKAPDGKVYFYNKVTRQSIWEKPKDFELVMPLPANLAGPSGSNVTGPPGPNMARPPGPNMAGPPGPIMAGPPGPSGPIMGPPGPHMGIPDPMV